MYAQAWTWENDALYHHGVLGQHWGVMNGPPYPLAPGDHSSSEKKAGWRKSLEYDNYKSAKKRYKAAKLERKASKANFKVAKQEKSSAESKASYKRAKLSVKAEKAMAKASKLTLAEAKKDLKTAKAELKVRKAIERTEVKYNKKIEKADKKWNELNGKYPEPELGHEKELRDLEAKMKVEAMRARELTLDRDKKLTDLTLSKPSAKAQLKNLDDRQKAKKDAEKDFEFARSVQPGYRGDAPSERDYANYAKRHSDQDNWTFAARRINKKGGLSVSEEYADAYEQTRQKLLSDYKKYGASDKVIERMNKATRPKFKTQDKSKAILDAGKDLDIRLFNDLGSRAPLRTDKSVKREVKSSYWYREKGEDSAKRIVKDDAGIIQRAKSMRRNGDSYSEIGKSLGLDPSTVYALVNEELL